MTSKVEEQIALKKEMLNCVIEKLQKWVDTKLVFTDKVQVIVENSGDDTVDMVSIRFNKPLGNKPGTDTVFLALHYKPGDCTFSQDHLRLHFHNYGGCFAEDFWIPTCNIRESRIVAHQAIKWLVKAMNTIRDQIHLGDTIASAYFPYALILTDEEYDKYKSIFE